MVGTDRSSGRCAPSRVARAAALICAMLAGACSGQQHAAPRDEWERLEAKAEDMTSTFRGKAWEYDMLPKHNTIWADVVRACGPQARKAGIQRFKAVAVIDRDGTIKQYLPRPDAEALDCFVRKMQGRRYPAPPESPFYEVFVVDLGEG